MAGLAKQRDDLRNAVYNSAINLDKTFSDIKAKQSFSFMQHALAFLGTSMGGNVNPYAIAKGKVNEEMNTQLQMLDRKQTLLGTLIKEGDSMEDAYAKTQARLKLLFGFQMQKAAGGLRDERAKLAALADVPDSAVPALASLAHEVRLEWCGDTVEVEGILSAKTGGCPEDCHFCSQSAKFESPVQAMPFLDTADVLAAARETAALGATEFCIVLAIRGPDERTMDRICELVPLVQNEVGLNVAVSAGIVTEAQAKRFADVGVHRYNHNLETAESFFENVVTTHTWAERFDTCQLVRDQGMELCCGVLLGMGESVDQRLELIGQLRAVDPAEVPLNFLNPRPGTPFAGLPLTEPLEAIRWISLFRLGLPSVILRYAGGREVTLRELQALGLTSGINAIIVGNYLTTLGRSPEEDLQMLSDLQMPIGALSKAI
jgi:biotin synthase